MKKFELPIGKNGGKVCFEITEDNHLNLMVIENGEVYNLSFMDCVFANKFSHDPHMLKKADRCNAFTKESTVSVEDNKILFATVLASEKTGKKVPGLIEYNLFTVSKENSSIKLETYFEQRGNKIYDCAFFCGRAKIEEDFFDTLYVPSKCGEFSIDSLTGVVDDEDGLVLKGENRYLKVSGGVVEFTGATIDAHIDSLRYNDTLSYYDKDNPIISYFDFEEVKRSAENISNTINQVADCEIIELNSGKMKVELVAEENSLSTLCDGKKYPLCAMRFKNINTEEDVYIDSQSVWKNVTVEKQGNNFVFTLIGCEFGNIVLKLTAEISEEENQIEWTTEVLNDSSEYSLVWCTYPRLYLKDERRCNLFEPCYGGSEKKNFTSPYQYTGGTYPSGFWYTMPYFALYEDAENPKDGIYYSVHDDRGSLKELYSCCDNKHIVRFSSRFYAENMYQPKNSNKLPGKTIWKMFDGDWYDATEIYRTFVDNNCEWAENDSDKNTPDWMKDIPFWIMDWVPYDKDSTEILPTNLRCDEDTVGDDDWYENAIKIKNEFDVPIGYHIYNWHQIPFNNDYPHFVPARDRFLNGYKKLKENGIRVMPYINAILWDTKDKGSEDYMFEAVGKKGAVKNVGGEVETLTFESRESNGELVRLAPMCPGEVWKATLVNLIQDMYEKYDFDAIYLDQIAARVPHLCMDKTHGHPLGGGSWWAEGYNDIIKALNSSKPNGKGFSTECNAEVYTKNMNAFLSWRWNDSKNDVPAFMRIYSDKVVVFGRNTNAKNKNNAMYWKYNIAEEFVCGQQLGWINSDVVKNEKRMQFLKKLVQFRYENRDFFRTFNVLRPPVVVKTTGNVIGVNECSNAVNLCGKSCLCVGALENDSKRMILIVNISDRVVTSDVKWKTDECNFDYNEFSISDAGKINFLGKDSINITVNKESFVCIEWMANK